jgi:RNA polymerase sigma factor (sigma-70 family)
MRVHDSDVPASTVPVPTGPDASVPDAISDTSVPDAISDASVPDAISDASVPDAISDASVPDATSDASVPDATSDASVPDATSDAAWLAEAYDSFAEALYAYCRSLVQEPAAAADAVQDTFVVTAFRLAELPEESLLRAWLHAVARNECLRAIAGGRATPALDFLANDSGAGGPASGAAAADEIPAVVVAEGGEPPEGTEVAEVRALLWASLGGLDPAERDLMIMTWHGLDVAECSAVLGISHDEASKVLFRGRDQLETSAGVMTVARSASHECAQLNDMLAGWDERLTPALHTEVRQHIDHCDICSGQRRTGMRPAILLRLAPDTLRGMSAGTSPLTAWVTSRLREQALAAAFDTEPESFERRAMVVRRSGPYRDDGFPVPLDPSGAGAARRRRSAAPLVLAGVGGTGLLAVAVIAGLALSGNHSVGALPSWAGLAQSATSPAGVFGSAASASTSPGARASASPHRSAMAPATTPGGKSPGASARPSASASARATPSKPGDPAPTIASAPLAAAKVGVSPGSLQLSSDRNGSYAGLLTLTNPTSSDMPWSISLPEGLATWGNVVSGTLQPSSGNQTDAGKTRLLIYTTSGGRHGHQQDQSQTQTITLQPGNVQVTVTIP